MTQFLRSLPRIAWLGLVGLILVAANPGTIDSVARALIAKLTVRVTALEFRATTNEGDISGLATRVTADEAAITMSATKASLALLAARVGVTEASLVSLDDRVTVLENLVPTPPPPPPEPPVLSITPASLMFDSTMVGATQDKSFTVQNTGSGTLTGTASTAGVFSIVVGGAFSLGAGQTQLTTIRFTPTSAVSFANAVTFGSNVGNASRPIQGNGIVLPPPPLPGAIVVPTGSDALVNGDNFQAAVNNAHCGDTIVLQAGASYQTRIAFINSYGPQGSPFSLPNKSCVPGQYTTIQTSALGSLPSGRISPANVGQMAQLSTNTNSWVIEPAPYAGNYRFIGIEFTNSASVPNNHGNVPVLFSSPSGGYYAYGQWAHDIIIDRSWFHPYEETANPTSNLRSASMAMTIDGANMTFQNSYCSGFMGFQANAPTVPAQSQCLGAVSGPGPLTITNNFLEAWYSNIFTGGGSGFSQNVATVSGASSTQATLSTVQNLGVGDLIAFQMAAPFTNLAGITTSWGVGQVTVISGNTVTFTGYGPDALQSAPAMPGKAQWNGVSLSNVTVRGNTLSKRNEWATGGFGIAKSYWEMKSGSNVVFDGNIVQGPPGAAPINAAFQRNQDGSSPWMTATNNRFTNNLFRGLGAVIVSFNDPYHSTKPGGGFVFSNNLIDGASKLYFMLTEGGSNWTITHNTVRGNTNSIFFSVGSYAAISGVTFRDNIVNSGTYFFNPNTDYPGKVEDHNVVINTSGSPPPSYMSGDWVVTSDAAVGFSNVSSADAGGDYHGYALSSASTFKGRASDGTDPGVNFQALDAALGG